MLFIYFILCMWIILKEKENVNVCSLHSWFQLMPHFMPNVFFQVIEQRERILTYFIEIERRVAGLRAVKSCFQERRPAVIHRQTGAALVVL